MSARPILFSGSMVRALLDGSKTQTRRIAKLTAGGHVKEPRGQRRWHPGCDGAPQACPYGQPGDLLWVRETWAHDAESVEACRSAYEDILGGLSYGPYYHATETGRDSLRWRPSIHMPRWASRITLRIINVRVERLQAISEADARAEGARPLDVATGRETLDPNSRQGSYTAHYRHIWETINGSDSWDANPWVWVVEFKRVTPA